MSDDDIRCYISRLDGWPCPGSRDGSGSADAAERPDDGSRADPGPPVRKKPRVRVLHPKPFTF